MVDIHMENQSALAMKEDPTKKWADRIVGALALVWIGFMIGNWHYDAKDVNWLWGQRAQVVVLQKTVKQEHCTIQKVTAVAKQAIVSANSDVVPTPDASALRPCPAPKK